MKFYRHFLRFVDTPKAHAQQNIFELVKETLTKYGLKVELIVAQCYDGIAKMTQIHRDVAAQVKQLNGAAINVHFHAQEFNQVLQDACSRKDSSVRDCLGLVDTLATFINEASKRQSLYRHFQDPKTSALLKKLSEIRWNCRYTAFNSVKEHFPGILSILKVN